MKYNNFLAEFILFNRINPHKYKNFKDLLINIFLIILKVFIYYNFFFTFIASEYDLFYRKLTLLFFGSFQNIPLDIFLINFALKNSYKSILSVVNKLFATIIGLGLIFFSTWEILIWINSELNSFIFMLVIVLSLLELFAILFVILKPLLKFTKYFIYILPFCGISIRFLIYIFII